MDNKIRIGDLPEEKYLVLFGIRKPTFENMLSVLETAYAEMRKKGGRKRKLSVLDMLIITLGYYHDYRTMENIAFDYGVHPQRVCEAIAFVEQALIKSSEFSLPSKRKLSGNNSQIVAVIIDATECETERPKKTKRQLFRKEKTPHYQRPNRDKRLNQRDNLCS